MKKRQTMGKMMRDRELRERRAMKQQKKDDKKLAVAETETDGEAAVDGVEDGSAGNGDAPTGELKADAS